MSEQGEGLVPLAGGWSGETFVSGAGGERVVVRIYGGRSAARGALAPEVDAAVLHLMRGIVPVPAVLEVRRGGESGPGLLVTEHLPGERADLVLPRLDAVGRTRLGHALGDVLDRLGHVPTTGPGLLVGRDLRIEPFPPAAADLPSYVDQQGPLLTGWPAELRTRLGDLADTAQDLLDPVDRSCLVHGDLNPKNLLVDPVTLAVTGVLDWEFAHSGSPYADLGNLLRFEREAAFTAAVLDRWEDPAGDLARARAADLFALVDLAVRDQAVDTRNPVTTAADRLLRRLVLNGDPGSGPD